MALFLMSYFIEGREGPSLLGCVLGLVTISPSDYYIYGLCGGAQDCCGTVAQEWHRSAVAHSAPKPTLLSLEPIAPFLRQAHPLGWHPLAASGGLWRPLFAKAAHFPRGGSVGIYFADKSCQPPLISLDGSCNGSCNGAFGAPFITGGYHTLERGNRGGIYTTLVGYTTLAG